MKRILLFFSVFAAIGALILVYLVLPVEGKRGDFTAIEVKRGEGLKDIATKLEKAEIVRSADFFSIQAFLSGSARALKPGNYVFHYGDSFSEIERILLTGPSDVEVTVFPGMTIAEIDNALCRRKILACGALSKVSVAEFKKDYGFLRDAVSLEGFLFPDTYFFLPDSDPKTIVSRFLDRFSVQALPFLKKGDIFKTVILASILEKEIPDYEEQRIGAGVLENRLAMDMPLQVDVTILYAKCGGFFSGCPVLTAKDLAAKSDFNTYKNIGLPPAAVSNPGLSSIKAAVNPAKTDYLFYLSDPETKKTIFSKTFNEHNGNRIKYLSE